ncbi:MAG TPA: hypothetical protein PKD09_17895, partial [Aggregatilinea sp.]|uniref:hypothetical protein n=1 Tax=Aggregatilinea sp. TaxID=2806333 RepID=UPI002BCBE45E
MANLTDIFTDIFADILGTLLEMAGITVEGDLGYLGYTPPGGSYTVRDDSGYLWAVVKSGETRGAVLARNDGNVPASPGLPVEVVTQIIQGKPQAVIKGSYPLLGDLFLGSSAASAGVGSHTHDDPSSELYDPVGEARLKPGLLAPYKVGETYTMRCQVLPFTMTIDGADIFVPRLLTPDLSSYLPSAGMRRLVKVGVRLSDLTVVVAAGSTEPASRPVRRDAGRDHVRSRRWPGENDRRGQAALDDDGDQPLQAVRAQRAIVAAGQPRRDHGAVQRRAAPEPRRGRDVTNG